MRAKSGNSSSVYAIISNTIVLVLIGFFSLLYLHTNSITNIIKERINILVELNEDSLGVSKSNELIKILESNPKIVKGSVKFISKNEASTTLGLEMTQELKSVGSPFKDIISFNVLSEHYSEDNLKKIKNELKKRPEVFDVFFENVVVENIKSNLRNVSFFVLLLSLVFVFLAVIIIYNTINLSLYADRWEIKNMEIIGARDSFIRQPYVKLAGNIALKSFLFAALLLLLFLFFLVKGTEFAGILKWYYVILSLFLMFIISIMITVTAAITIVNRYLYKKQSELYSI
jgi:cell division transport system permease protein